MTTEAERDSGSDRHWLTIGVRARILTTVLLLAALGMGLSGAAFMVFERRQLVDHLDGVLLGDVATFTTRARAATSEATVADLLRAELNQHVPTDGEVLLGLVDGRPAFVTRDDRPFAIEQETALIADVAALPADAPTQIRQVTSQSAGPLRYVAVQVRVAGRSEVGTLVTAVSLQPALDRLAASARLYAALSLAALVLVGLGGWIVAGRLLRPLRLLRQAAEGISRADLTSRIPVTGADDVTQLTRTVNAMLDRLEDAFDTQQQFLDDAGHELRTPITIVRGHLEVLNAADPAEVHATRALVMDELDRMARLVNDLIVLAQSGRPDFVRLEAVDIDQLLHDVLDKAQALADRSWVLDSTGLVVALADGHRLTQAMLQLIDNAVRHTGPADTIAVGGVISRGQVHLWVRDTGPGVSEQDAERIFVRFGRAGGARRDSGGSGLGLSIVNGIAAGHGGRVVLGRPTGGGARFTLILPLGILHRTAAHPATLGAPSTRWAAPSPAQPFWTREIR